MLPEFINDHLEDVLVDHFADLLNEELLHDKITNVQKALGDEIDSYYEVRYLLIDGESGQLETRVFFETIPEAEDWAKRANLQSYQIGELVVPAI